MNTPVAGYAGLSVRLMDGRIGTIIQSEFSEPDGSGGFKVDLWVLCPDGTVQTWYDCTVNMVDDMTSTAPFPLAALCEAFVLLADTIAKDWTDNAQDWQRSNWTKWDIIASMENLCFGSPSQGIEGFLHPEFTPESKCLNGYWSM